MARSVSGRLRKNGLSGRTVTLKLRHHDFETHTRSSTLANPTDNARILGATARALLEAEDVSNGLRLLGVGVSGLADWVQEDLFASEDDDIEEDEAAEAAEAARPTRFYPGMDVHHDDHGDGWVWGAGLGRVTVRFETRHTPPGPIHTFQCRRPRSGCGAHRYVCRMTAPIPAAEIRPIVRSHHGDDFVDDYEWLRDKEDPATLAYLEAENAYTDESTAHLEPLRQQIFDEIKARTLETDLSVPVRRGDWWYYARTVEGQQYAIRCRCPIGDADDWNPPTLDAETPIEGEQVMLDSNVEADGHEFFSLGAFSVTDDGNLLAWSVDTQGDERYTIKVKDLRTGEVLPDEITGDQRRRDLVGRRDTSLLHNGRRGVAARTRCGGTPSARPTTTFSSSRSRTSATSSASAAPSPTSTS